MAKAKRLWQKVQGEEAKGNKLRLTLTLRITLTLRLTLRLTFRLTLSLTLTLTQTLTLTPSGLIVWLERVDLEVGWVESPSHIK